jgi:adenylate cyclase 10
MTSMGSNLIIVFGLPPMSHQDDPTRSILTSLALKALLSVKCSIGIATGTVYSGVVGTSGSRREYSVLGESVNLASKLMQLACTGNKIILEQETAKEASSKITLKFLKQH